jgi:hypothetical protein
MFDETPLKATFAVRILELLAEGRSLRRICAASGMPARRTVRAWQDNDPEFAAAVIRAREIGFEERAEAAVEEAKASDNAPLGRLAFDAERWYLGKLSQAFSDSKEQRHRVEHDLSDAAKEWLGQGVRQTSGATPGVLPGPAPVPGIGFDAGPDSGYDLEDED